MTKKLDSSGVLYNTIYNIWTLVDLPKIKGSVITELKLEKVRNSRWLLRETQWEATHSAIIKKENNV